MKFAAFQNPAVFTLLNKLFSASLPVKVAYRLSKIQKVVGSEAEKYQELRMAIVNKFGVKDDAGELVSDESGNVKLMEDKIEDVVSEMNDLHDIELELPSKIKIDDLETIELTAYELTILEQLDILEE